MESRVTPTFHVGESMRFKGDFGSEGSAVDRRLITASDQPSPGFQQIGTDRRLPIISLRRVIVIDCFPMERLVFAVFLGCCALGW